MLSQLMMFFGFFALVLASVYWVNNAVLLFDRLISDGQSVWVFLEMTALSLPNVIRLMLPIAAFAAALYTTNQMASESELVVMQATGFSPFRLARPVLFFGLVVAVLISVLSHFLVPASRTRLNERDAEITQNITSKLLAEGKFIHPLDSMTIYIRTIAPSGELTDMFLSDSREPARATIYSAKRAFLAKSDSGPKLVMFDGMAQVLNKASGQLSVTRFSDFTYDISALIAARGPRNAALEERSTTELLWPDARLLAETGVPRAAAVFEGHDRFAKPLLAVATALVAFATMLSGGFSRFGLWRQMTAASGLLIALFFCMNVTDKLAAQDETLVGLVYLPAILGLMGAGLMLAWSARRRGSPRRGSNGTGGGGMLAA